MQPAIRINELSKLYCIGTRQQGYRTLRESIAEACWAPMKRLCRSGQATADNRNHHSDKRVRGSEFWALKNVSFEVQPGEIVGVIGRNGAGKSTLLKILSRVTEPTGGRIEVRGRIGSLLEVGTGFHPELTGRENIYMNGSILGMHRREIHRKFDEIVAFAEIEDFLETPVKRYSSGMYVRLAFAVAAHLEPEILIVDEVLAVGDAAFQKKCIGKIGEVARTGRTVLFVSHNLATIANLCNQAVLLDGGILRAKSRTPEVLAQYSSEARSNGSYVDIRNLGHRSLNGPRFLRALCLRNAEGVATDHFFCGDSISFDLDVQPWNDITTLVFTVIVHDGFGGKLFSAASYLSKSRLDDITAGQRVRCVLDELALAPGYYTVSVWAGPPHHSEMDAAELVTGFTISESDYYGSGRRPHPSRGPLLMKSSWLQLPSCDSKCLSTGGLDSVGDLQNQ